MIREVPPIPSGALQCPLIPSGALLKSPRARGCWLATGWRLGGSGSRAEVAAVPKRGMGRDWGPAAAESCSKSGLGRGWRWFCLAAMCMCSFVQWGDTPPAPPAAAAGSNWDWKCPWAPVWAWLGSSTRVAGLWLGLAMVGAAGVYMWCRPRALSFQLHRGCCSASLSGGGAACAGGCKLGDGGSQTARPCLAIASRGYPESRGYPIIISRR